MKTQQHNDRSVTPPTGNPLSRLAWLVVGVGIGAAAGILLAPQSGEDTRDWISTKCKSGMRSMNSQVRQTSQSVGDWIGQSQHQVSEAVSAGREAFSKAKNGA
jgi:gas vesicle protein